MTCGSVGIKEMIVATRYMYKIWSAIYSPTDPHMNVFYLELVFSAAC